MKLVYPKLRATIFMSKLCVHYIVPDKAAALTHSITKLLRAGKNFSLGKIWRIIHSIRSYPGGSIEQRCFLRCPAQKPGLNCPTISEGLHLTLASKVPESFPPLLMLRTSRAIPELCSQTFINVLWLKIINPQNGWFSYSTWSFLWVILYPNFET